MLRQQIANLFYEILTTFPRELTQLLAEYVDILPTKYMIISNTPSPREFFPTAFEVIPNKGLILYDDLGTGYQKIDLRENFKKEYVQNDDATQCIVNESGDDFIIYHSRPIRQLIDDTYLSTDDGICKYSLTSPELELVILGDFGFIAKVREGYIIQTEKMDAVDFNTMNTFVYDRYMENPVELTAPYGRIRRIFETAKHLYVIDYKRKLYIDNKHVDVPNDVDVLGVYQDHIVGAIFTNMGEPEKLLMLEGSDWRVLYTGVSPAILSIKCCANEIYVLTRECLYKLSEEMVS